MSKDLVAEVDMMQEVVALLMQQKNPTEISKELGISRAKVLDYRDSWKKFVAKDQDIKDKAKETLARVDEHYSVLIREMYRQYEQADSNAERREAINALKALAQFEKDRATLFQAAGITADDKLTEQMMETERKQEILMTVLREIDCGRCRTQIRKRLAEITGEAEVIRVVEVVNPKDADGL